MDRRSSNGWGDLTTLLAVLSHGQEQTRQLEAHLLDAAADPSSMHQLLLCKSLARQIESTFRTAISVVEGSSSPSSATDVSHQSSSSRSPDRDRLLIDDDHERMEIMCNKRKSALRWTRQVRVCPSVGAGIEEPLLADGYSWRKYGQKDILGAKYPRSYYRCTHRNSRGCLATKQVQRSDENPFLMDVTYRGAHTCTEKHETVVEALSLQKDTGHINSQNNDLLQQQQQQLHKQPLMSLRAPPLALKKTDHDLNSRRGQILDPSPTTLETASYIDTNFSPSTFMLAPRGASSEMNYLPLSGRCGVSNYGAQEEAELAANTPMSDMDFGFRQGGDFGTDFPFDGSSFY